MLYDGVIRSVCYQLQLDTYGVGSVFGKVNFDQRIIIVTSMITIRIRR